MVVDVAVSVRVRVPKFSLVCTVFVPVGGGFKVFRETVLGTTRDVSVRSVLSFGLGFVLGGGLRISVLLLLVVLLRDVVVVVLVVVFVAKVGSCGVCVGSEVVIKLIFC